MDKCPQDKCCLDKCHGDSCNLLYIIQDLTLAGAVGGLNRLFYAQMRRTTAAAAAIRVHFVENGRPEQTNFQKIPTHQTRGSGSISWNAICIYQLIRLSFTLRGKALPDLSLGSNTENS